MEVHTVDRLQYIEINLIKPSFITCIPLGYFFRFFLTKLVKYAVALNITVITMYVHMLLNYPVFIDVFSDS